LELSTSGYNKYLSRKETLKCFINEFEKYLKIIIEEVGWA
jgi:hypothetical protein